MSDFILTNLPCSGRILIVADAVTEQAVCTSGSVVEYRLAKARVAGSNPVSCSQRYKKETSDGCLFFVCSSPAGLERFECRRSTPVVATISNACKS